MKGTIRAGHRQSKGLVTDDTDSEQPTSHNRHPTARNQQQPGTATPENQHLVSTTDSRHPPSINNYHRQLAKTEH
jgi:hypothetical protein